MNNIKKQRAFIGLTQKQLCEQAGICSSSHLSDMELGKVLPGVLAAIRIARALETTVEELFKSNEGDNND